MCKCSVFAENFKLDQTESRQSVKTDIGPQVWVLDKAAMSGTQRIHKCVCASESRMCSMCACTSELLSLPEKCKKT